MSRERFASYPSRTGSSRIEGSPSVKDQDLKVRSWSSYYAHCLDVNDRPGGNNPFNLRAHKVLTPDLYQGSYPSFGGHIITRDLPSKHVKDFRALDHLSVDLPPPDGAIADTNPSRPEVDIPVFLGELKDVPRMAKQALAANIAASKALGAKNMRDMRKLVGNELSSSNPGNAYLAYKFGWLPFISDLYGMMGLGSFAKQRQNEILSHRNKGGLRYKRKVGKSTKRDSEWIVLNDFPFSHGGTAYTKTTAERWVTVRYTPVWEKVDPYSSNQHLKIIRAITGMELSYSLAWELLPWSWMFDWFSNTGDVLKLRRNIAGYKFSRASVMTHIETVQKVRPDPLELPVSGGSSVISFTTKNRVPYYPSLPRFSQPFFNADQLAVLAALFVAQGR